jgi:hypothetical protein
MIQVNAKIQPALFMSMLRLKPAATRPIAVKNNADSKARVKCLAEARLTQREQGQNAEPPGCHV